jgi:hypothetical protein
MSCIVDSAPIYIIVAKFWNTNCPPPPQLSLHRRAALSTNSNGTRSVYSRKNPKRSLYCEMTMDGSLWMGPDHRFDRGPCFKVHQPPLIRILGLKCGPIHRSKLCKTYFFIFLLWRPPIGDSFSAWITLVLFILAERLQLLVSVIA